MFLLSFLVGYYEKKDTHKLGRLLAKLHVVHALDQHQ